MGVMKHFAMSVCMCPKESLNYGQTVGVFFFFHKEEWANIVVKVSQSKIIAKLQDRFKSNNNFTNMFSKILRLQT